MFSGSLERDVNYPLLFVLRDGFLETCLNKQGNQQMYWCASKPDTRKVHSNRTEVTVWLFLIFSFTPISALKTFCKVEALNGDSVSVQCTYPMNIRDTRQSISLMQFGTNGQRTDAAYSCAWKEEQLNCISENGFFYPNNVTKELTFKVENPYNNAEFSCDTISPDKSLNVERCHLNKEANDSAPITTEQPLSTTCKPTPVDERDCSCTASNATLSVVSVILAVVLVAFFFRERKTLRRMRNLHINA